MPNCGLECSTESDFNDHMLAHELFDHDEDQQQGRHEESKRSQEVHRGLRDVLGLTHEHRRHHRREKIINFFRRFLPQPPGVVKLPNSKLKVEFPIYNYDHTHANANEEPICAICQDDFHDNEEVCILQCLHRYHLYCIKKWLIMKNECPTCKHRQGT